MYITNPMQTREGRARRILIRTIIAAPMQNAGSCKSLKEKLNYNV
jgi:hypothetical protein